MLKHEEVREKNKSIISGVVVVPVAVLALILVLAVFRSSSPGRVKNFLFSMSSRPALGSTQPPIQWVPGALSRE
jgi:hypothetical protein